jgi:hypothetical protein
VPLHLGRVITRLVLRGERFVSQLKVRRYPLSQAGVPDGSAVASRLVLEKLATNEEVPATYVLAEISKRS